MRHHINQALHREGFHQNPFEPAGYLGSWREWYTKALELDLIDEAQFEAIRDSMGDDVWFHAFNN